MRKGAPITPEKSQIILSQIDPFDNILKILILRKTRNGLWGFPGGGIEAGESPMDCVCREIDEELHINIKNIKINSTHTPMRISYNYGNDTRDIILSTGIYATPLLPVNISIIDDPKYPQPEHFEFRWVSTKAEIRKLPFGSDDLKSILMKRLK